MTVRQLDDLNDIGVDVLGTTQAANGVILAQTGDVVAAPAGADAAVSSDNAEVWGPPGFVSRPAKAIAGKSACQALTVNQGSNDCIVGFRDVRCAGLPGAILEGETCVYAPGPSNQGTGRILLKDNGATSTITIHSNGSISIDVPSVRLGAGASIPIALAPAIQVFAAAVVVAIGQVAALLNAPGTVIGAPGSVTPIPPLDPSASSATVNASA